jgi:pilus assembly protein CpaC
MDSIMMTARGMMATVIWGICVVGVQAQTTPPRGATREYRRTVPSSRLIEPVQGPLTVRLAQQIETLEPIRPQPDVQPPPTDAGPLPEPAEPATPFAPNQFRLPLLDQPRALGSTPRPTAETLNSFRRYVAGTVDPANTFDLVEGRPRILMLKAAPTRVQIADETVARVTVISNTELSIDGMQVGTTVLNIWFGEPGQQDVLSYLVRVIPDPEQRERLERLSATKSS